MSWSSLFSTTGNLPKGASNNGDFFGFQPHFLNTFILHWNKGVEDKNDNVIAKSIKLSICINVSTSLQTVFFAMIYLLFSLFVHLIQPVPSCKDLTFISITMPPVFTSFCYCSGFSQRIDCDSGELGINREHTLN